MTVIDLETLLQPVSDEEPAGENLEYDLAFAELERAASWTDERQAGETVIPAEEPAWRDVKPMALALFGRTRDLRVAVHLAQALAAVDGLPGFADGLRLIRGLVERFWDTVHPLLDTDEGADPIFRVNCLAQLSDPERTLRVLRGALLVEARAVGRFTVRDLLLVEGAASGGEREGGASRPLLYGALQESGPEFLQVQLDAVTGSLADVAAILTRFQAHGDGTGYPDFDPLIKLLSTIRGFYAAGVAGLQGVTGSDGAPHDLAQSVAVSGQSPAAMGALHTREDIKRTLAEVCQWLERNEPGHPAPLLIQRASRLLDMSFIEIVQDMAPSGVAEVCVVSGTPPPEA